MPDDHPARFLWSRMAYDIAPARPIYRFALMRAMMAYSAHGFDDMSIAYRIDGCKRVPFRIISATRQ